MNETEKEREERLKREIEVRSNGYRCGECGGLSYYREFDRWECRGMCRNPSDDACWKFHPSERPPVEGTFPEGLPLRLVVTKSDAGKKPAKRRPRKPKTNYDALMRSFKENEDNLIDYLQTDCGDCVHENTCPHAYKKEWGKCREYIRAWLHEPYPG